MSDHAELFSRWYLQPLKVLQDLPSGDGGFIALATSCYLYERYAIAAIIRDGGDGTRDQIIKRLSEDFSIDNEAATFFWDIVRNGVLHQGMPKQQQHGQSLPRWAFHHSYPAISLEEVDDQPLLKVEPWRFMERVIELWEANLELLNDNQSFPWARIADVPD